MGTSRDHSREGAVHLGCIRHGKFIDDHVPAKFFRDDQKGGDNKEGAISIPQGAVEVLQLSCDEKIGL
jgi:hypothetical protein